jgi:transposase-like protein
MPVGRPSEYDPKFCDTVIECGRRGMSVTEMACAVGVTKQTLHNWVDKHPEFLDAFTYAKQLSQTWWEEQARIGLYSENGKSLNASLWSRSMAARFPDEYTEKRKNEHSGPDGTPLNFTWRDAFD